MVGDKKIVILCTSRIYDTQVQSYIETLNEKIKTENCRLIIYSLNSDLYWEEDSHSPEIAVFDIIPYDKADAIIIMDEKIKSKRVSRRIIKESSERNIPVIVVDGDYQGTCKIRFDYGAGFEELVRHVVEHHGAKRPHLISGIKGNAFSIEREEVFRRVLSENGIPCDEDTISYGDFWAAPARAAMHAVLDRDVLPDAVICANDIMAINVCDVIRESGYSVPGDMIVTGFDGYDETFLSTPGITTSSCDISYLAEASADVLKVFFMGKRSDAEVKVRPRMYANESCGCDRCSEIANKLALKRFNNEFYRYQDDIRIIHDTTARMLSAHSWEDAISCLRSDYTRNIVADKTGNIFCLLDKSCMDESRNYYLSDSRSGEYYLVYDERSNNNVIIPFDIGDIAPDLEKLLESGYPLIFQTLDYMGKAMGYICYFMTDYKITNYAKTPNITDMVSQGLGGYINMRYEQYLLSKVEDMYRIDGLTGLLNRLAFNEAFEEMKTKPENSGRTLTVFMIDLNHLKIINDKLGHAAGDRAIAAVAAALRSVCPEETLCVRFGGDEMLAFVPGDCDPSQIISEMESLLKEASEKNGYEISASCGTYQTVLSKEMDMEDAVRHADEEMYIVKKRSRGEAV